MRALLAWPLLPLLSLPLSLEAMGPKEELLAKYANPKMSSQDLKALKKLTLKHGGRSVSALIEVMKNGRYPDRGRWMATLLLGRIMGHRAIPFIRKFLKHPHWIMRLASLKALLALGDRSAAGDYAQALRDKGLIVRAQALKNIEALGLKELSHQVLAMMEDPRNYYVSKSGERRPTSIIKSAIRTVGNFRYRPAQGPLAEMIQQDQHQGLIGPLDRALSQVTGLSSPPGDGHTKRRFWARPQLNAPTP